MKKLHVCAAPALLGIVFGSTSVAEANLALSLNANASISALSAQLLKKPRSQAGTKVNVWDCDPPLPAVTGVHYFLYNLDGNNNPLPQNDLVMTMRGARFGPGYGGALDLLVRPGGPGTPTQYVKPNTQTQLYDLNGFEELGLARLTFTLSDNPGFINQISDIEVDYDAQDINHQPSNERGFEHARFTTEYVSNTPAADARIARGLMTAVVPAAYNGLAPAGQPFVDGFLDFGNGNIASGANVFTATVATDPLQQVWISTVAGLWDEAVRWQDGEIANGTDVTARFNAVDQVSIVDVTLTENRFVRALEFGDTAPATAGGYRLQGNQITLTSATPAITIGAFEPTSRARLDTVLGGTSGVTIIGGNVQTSVAAGGLWLTAANTYSGGTTINNATVYLGAPGNSIAAASFGAPTSNVVLNGYNFIGNATIGTNGGIVLNHDFVARAGSNTTFLMGNRCDFGIPSGNPSVPGNKRFVTGSGNVTLTGAATGTGLRVYSDFTGFNGKLVFNGSGTIQPFVNGGFIGTGFGSAAVVVDGSAVLAFQTSGGGTTTIYMGSLAGASGTAGINPSNIGPVNLSIGALNTSTTFNGFIAGANGLTKVGTGTLALGGNNSYTGTTTVMSGILSMTQSGRGVLLNGIGTTGGADIRGGKLRFTYNSPPMSPAMIVESLLTAGYAQANRFSSGALRSVGIPGDRVLGWRDDKDTRQLDVAYTISGDADVDFDVDFDDLVVLAQSYNLTDKEWDDGDFNYDNQVNFNDLVPLAQNYNQSLSSDELGMLGADFAADWARAMSFVPEPGTMGVFSLGVVSLLRRRR